MGRSGAREVKISFAGQSLTHFGGLFLLHRFVQRLGLRQLRPPRTTQTLALDPSVLTVYGRQEGEGDAHQVVEVFRGGVGAPAALGRRAARGVEQGVGVEALPFSATNNSPGKSARGRSRCR